MQFARGASVSQFQEFILVLGIFSGKKVTPPPPPPPAKFEGARTPMPTQIYIDFITSPKVIKNDIITSSNYFPKGTSRISVEMSVSEISFSVDTWFEMKFTAVGT